MRNLTMSKRAGQAKNQLEEKCPPEQDATRSVQSRFPPNVFGGREYIETYVSYVHYVEGMYEAAMNPASGHYTEGATAPHEDK